MKRIMLAAAMALALAACGQQPAQQAAAPEVAEPTVATPAALLRNHIGSAYPAFVQQPGMGRYAPQNLGLGAETERFAGAMQAPAASRAIADSGVEALVFTGCAAADCAASGVLAIDLATGDAFVGVKDAAGEAILKPNARLQMLLTATSPSRAWSDPRP